jgi:hypothetical protein
MTNKGTEELKTDICREGCSLDTGIFVRAKKSDGTWDSVDISELTVDSLLEWLRSRGGDNKWAESVVLQLLGHRPDDAMC